LAQASRVLTRERAVIEEGRALHVECSEISADGFNERFLAEGEEEGGEGAALEEPVFLIYE
jgi:hypothetical protein